MKLTNMMRESIVAKVTDEKFPVGKLNSLKDELSKVLRDRMDERLINGWEKYSKYINRVSVIHIRTASFGSVSISCREYPYTGLKSYMSEDDLTPVEKSIFDEIVRFIDGKKKFMDDMKKVCMSVNTDRQLIDIIPEIEQYIPEATKNNSLVDMKLVRCLRSMM